MVSWKSFLPKKVSKGIAGKLFPHVGMANSLMGEIDGKFSHVRASCPDWWQMVGIKGELHAQIGGKRSHVRASCPDRRQVVSWKTCLPR